jgi:hypothetical protein
MIEVWVLGGVILWRLKRLHICAAYAAAFAVFAVLRSALTGNPLLAAIAPITGPMYQLFIFFMITDPRTTVSSGFTANMSAKTAQSLVVIAVAAVEAVLRLRDVVYAPLFALFIVGPAALGLELWLRTPLVTFGHKGHKGHGEDKSRTGDVRLGRPA